MKITVIGSHLCPDTLYALNQLAAAGAEVSFQDILSCHAALLTRRSADLPEHPGDQQVVRLHPGHPETGRSLLSAGGRQPDPGTEGYPRLNHAIAPDGALPRRGCDV